MLTIAVALLAASVSNTGWRTYTNVRYGYTTCYPSWMAPQREADNGDGRVFLSSSAKITVWGSNNYLDQSPIDYARSLRKSGESITYQVVRPNWIVQSGIVGPRIFWRKYFRRDDQFVTIEVIYPVEQKIKYDPMIKMISSCSRIGSPGW